MSAIRNTVTVNTCPKATARVTSVVRPSRREAMWSFLAVPLTVTNVQPTYARDYKEALKEKEARKAALRAAAEREKSSGKDEEIFDTPEYSVSEEARTPNVHSRQNEGARTQSNI